MYDCQSQLRRAGLQLQEPFDLDPWVEEALVSRCCLPLLAALLHVPKLQALHQKQAGTLMPGQTPEHIQVRVFALCHTYLPNLLKIGSIAVSPRVGLFGSCCLPEQLMNLDFLFCHF